MIQCGRKPPARASEKDQYPKSELPPHRRERLRHDSNRALEGPRTHTASCEITYLSSWRASLHIKPSRSRPTGLTVSEKLIEQEPEVAAAAVRAIQANLKDSYGLLKDGELWLLNCHIGPYDHGNIFNHAPLRTRKLLVHKEEIRKLIGKTQQKGLTLIPTRLYFKNGRVKVELALAKGKQLWDKRETERRRTADSEAREAIARSGKGR